MLIGNYHWSCYHPDCSLVDNWNDLETKQSYKGKCAFYKLSNDNWVALDLVHYDTNDLGTYENIEIKFKSGKIMRTKPTSPKAKLSQKVLTSGSNPKEEPPEIFLKDQEIILFFNNSYHTANLEGAEDIYLENIWDIKEKTNWDREKSKKKVFLFTENEPSAEAETTKIDAANKDYLFYIADPSITNVIKDYEVYSPSKSTEERDRLYKDKWEELSELKEVYGIRHNLQAKEERQNNPEIDMIKSPFLALERDKWRERKKSIKEFEKKGNCSGKHVLSYGSLSEHQAEILIQQQVENLEKSEEKKLYK